MERKNLASEVQWRCVANVLRHTRRREATDRRDRIYGVLRVLRGYVDITPSYSRTENEAEVFEDATAQIMQSTGSLRMLNFAQVTSKSGPSWGCDFNSKSETGPVYDDFPDGAFKIPDGRWLQITHPRRGVLQLSGVFFDTVKEIVHPSSGELDKRITQQMKYIKEVATHDPSQLSQDCITNFESNLHKTIVGRRTS